MRLGLAFSKTLSKKSSSLSGDIVVKQKGEERQLIVGGLVQSINSDASGIEKRVWGEMADSIFDFKFPISNCLILGLGGGTVAQLLVRKYPRMRIVGVEVDPEIVAAGKRYFGLGKIRNLRIITADAFEVVRRPKKYRLAKERFELVIVDIYLGRLFPQEFGSFSFFESLKQLLKPGGGLVVNRIFSPGERMEKKHLVDRLRKFFDNVLVREVRGVGKERNFIFSARRKSL